MTPTINNTLDILFGFDINNFLQTSRRIDPKFQQFFVLILLYFLHEKIATAFSCMTICTEPGSDRAIEMAIPILYYFIIVY